MVIFNQESPSPFSVTFSEVSSLVGLNQTGESWGVAWADFNNDGRPDIWVTNHLSLASLYQNTDTGFIEITNSALTIPPTRDYHGSAWADFDNDGDQDLILQTASDNGVGKTELLVNNNGILSNQAASLGVATPAKGRMPLWFDYNRDALLDLVIAAGAREIAPPTIFEQVTQGESFVSANDTTGFDVNNSRFSLISDLDGDDAFELIIDGGSQIFNTSTASFQEESSTWFPNGKPNNVEDALTGDFNGDLAPDLFVVRSRNRSDLIQPASTSLRGLLITKADQKGIEFNTDGSITIELPTLSVDKIFIGSSGVNPTQREFTLSADDVSHQGLTSYQPGVDQGAYIGYDTASQKWQVFWSSPNVPGKIKSQYIFINSESTISNAVAVGFEPDQQALSEQLFINTGTSFIDASQTAGLSQFPTFAKNSVAADFDNDMDLDIYAVATSVAGNRNNILYENLGDGTFVLHESTANSGETTLGLGDSASAVDYNLDGFVDIFVTNGNFFLGYGNISRAFYDDAPYQLFENQSNNNHWLQLDLQGTASNRDGVGAKIYATAGGTTQLREQNGGIHNKSQNHQRVHFGLAQNTVVDSLEIRWSSEILNYHQAVDADQLLTIKEGVGLKGADRIVGNAENNVLKGKGGNDILEGGAGRDTLNGGLGIDTATYINSIAGVTINRTKNTATGGDAEGDRLRSIERIVGSSFKDILTGSDNDDILEGGNGPDRLIGNGGEDILNGGKRGDLLIGGSGNDRLTGGSGGDKFRFNTLLQAGIDTIQDFQSQLDIIQIKGSQFGGELSKGFLSETQFVLGTTATSTAHRVVYHQATGQLFFDTDGMGGQAQSLFAVLDNQSALVESDIRVI